MRALSGLSRILGDRGALLGLGTLLSIVLLGITGVVLYPQDPMSIRGPVLQPPSPAHVLGTDDLGRDVFIMLSRGVLVSLAIGLLAAILTTVLGMTTGIIAAVYGGAVDFVVMRLVEFLMAMPSVVLAMILVVFLKPSLWNIVLVLAVTGWPGIARISRGHSLQVLSTGYVEAARSLGAGVSHIVLRHLVPANIPVTLASIVSSIRSAVLLEAGLSFLGLGDPSTVSLGTILFYARRSAALASGAWWTFVPAGIVITLIVFGLTMISIGIERSLYREQRT